MKRFIAELYVLCPKNNDVDEINRNILAKYAGDSKIFYSSIVQPRDNDGGPLLPAEFIQNNNSSGLPPHTLELKTNSIVMLIRNIDVNKGS